MMRTYNTRGKLRFLSFILTLSILIGLIPAGTLPVFAVEATEHNHDEGVSVTCTCGTEDESIHATDCPAYVAPETAVCTCAEKCTEDNANVWCDVCGFDASACTGTDMAAAYADSLTVTIDTGDSVTLNDTDGDGYYEIGTADELYAFAALVNGGKYSINGKLTANITVNENVLKADDTLNGDGTNFRAWTPIDNIGMYFGTFDGDNKTISGLYFSDTNSYAAGLFGYVGWDEYADVCGTVKNVGVVNSYFSGKENVGGVVGIMPYGGAVENCYSSASVSGGNCVGGVVGYSRGTVRNCYNTGSVSGTGNYVGGVVGQNDGTVENCYNTGTVNGSQNVGGVVGTNRGTVENCYNTGSVSGTYYVGGVAGSNHSGATVKNSYNTGTVSGTSDTGGVLGINNSGTVTNCYYLTGCAMDGQAIQNGIGAANQGSATEDVEDGTVTTGYSDFSTGEVAWLLNGETSDGVWKQTLADNGDATPNFTGSTVYYGYTSCLDEVMAYTNEVASKTKPHDWENGRCMNDCGYTHTPHTWSNGVCTECLLTCEHSAGWANGVCNECGAAHDPHSYENGFCTCGGYEEPKLVNGVYQIANAGQLYWFADYVTEAQGYADAVLTDNIVVTPGTFDASGNYTPKDSETRRDWTPIGDANFNYQYYGTFDGQGHTISGLYFNDSTAEYVGLFGWVYDGTVKNVGVVDSYLCGKGYVGGVVGYLYANSNSASVENCYNIGIVSGTSNFVGGVVGCLYANDEGSRATVTNCYNTGNVSGNPPDGYYSNYIGGVVGANMAYSGTATVANCYNTGNVSSSGGSYYVGGVAGDSYTFNNGTATIENCYYLTNCATDGGGYTQQGIGANGSGNITADVVNEDNTVVTAVKTLDEFKYGGVAWLLNGGKSTGVWKQTLGEGGDASPNFTGKTVYQSGTGYTNHEHIWSYEGSGNQIQATCTAEGCTLTDKTVTITLVAHAGTYDGTTAYTVDVSDNPPNVFTVPEDAITYTANDADGELTNGLPVKAGSYTATLTLGEGTNQAIASVTYSIAECPHEFANGVCTKCNSVCGTDVDHEFVDGVCKNCNQPCEHTDGTNATWSDGFCTQCGAEHNHTTYTYIVAEDKTSITAKCEECGGTVGTLSFISESVEYDGHVLGLSNAVSATGIFVDLIAEESEREDDEKRFALTSCHADTCFDNFATSTDETCKTAVGCKNAGTHSLTLTFTDGANSYEITDTITVTPKALTITEIYYEKIYDGTTTVVPNSVSFSGEVEYKYLNWGYEYTYFDDVEVNVELVTFPDSVPGTYTTVHLSGITLSGNSAGNYYISEEMDLTGEFVIEQIELTIKPVDQIIAQGSAPDNTKFTVTNSNYETVTGLTIEGVEITAEGDTLYINTKNVTIKQGDTDVTAYYNINNGGEDDSYYTANASWACPNHTFNTDGFCATGGCTLYEPATLVNGTDEWGNPMEVYEISNAGQLYWFAEQVNNGNTYINGRLKNNITVNTTLDENARIWTPIGSEYRPYTGSFDGQGYTISGLYFNDENAKFVGLFGRTGYNYTIQHLALSNSYFKGSDYVGGLIGNAETILSNCYVTDSVTVEGSQNTGLLVGSNGGTITNCYAPGVLTGGGYGSYENCYYIGEDDGNDGTTAVTAEQMKSGEVAYLLQSGIVGEEVYDEETDSWVTQAPDEVWGQTIGTEDYPVFDGAKVYQKQNCNGETLYRNIDEDVTHNYGELIPATEEVHTETELKAAVAAHYYCSECQGYFTEDYTPTTLDELTGEVPTHNYEYWQPNIIQHRKKCECGATTERVYHTFDSTTHYCECGFMERIISVDIAWGEMEFTYDDTLDEEGNEKGWTCADGANMITIENNSNDTVLVTFDYMSLMYTEIEGSFTDGTKAVTWVGLGIDENNKTKTVYFNLTGKPSVALEYGIIGTITLTIE